MLFSSNLDAGKFNYKKGHKNYVEGQINNLILLL